MMKEHERVQRRYEDESHGPASLPCFDTILTPSNVTEGSPFRNWCGSGFSQSTRTISVGGGNEELRKLDIQVCRKAGNTSTKWEEMKVSVSALLVCFMQNGYRDNQFPETCMKNNEFLDGSIVKVDVRMCKIRKYIKSYKPLENLSKLNSQSSLGL